MRHQHRDGEGRQRMDTQNRDGEGRQRMDTQNRDGVGDSAWTGLQDPGSGIITSIYRLQLEPKSHGAVIGCFRG